MLQNIRAFIAVNLEVNAIRRVAAVQRTMRSSPEAPQAAWVAPPNMHIALRSIGEIDPALAPAISDGLRDVLGNTPPIRIQIAGVDAFPSPEQARVLLVSIIDASASLENLVNRIDEMVQGIGMTPESRPFRPHIVLARMTESADVANWLVAHGKCDTLDSQLTECVLYEGKVDGAEFAAIDRIGMSAMQAGRSVRARSRHPSQRPKGRSKPPPAQDKPSMEEAIPRPPKLPTLTPPPDTDDGLKE